MHQIKSQRSKLTRFNNNYNNRNNYDNDDLYQVEDEMPSGFDVLKMSKQYYYSKDGKHEQYHKQIPEYYYSDYANSLFALTTTADCLIKQLCEMSQHPTLPPHKLKAWKDISVYSKSDLRYAIDYELQWKWDEIGMKSPFEKVHNNLLKRGYWLKCKRVYDKKNYEYFRISVGFYIVNNDY